MTKVGTATSLWGSLSSSEDSQLHGPLSSKGRPWRGSLKHRKYLCDLVECGCRKSFASAHALAAHRYRYRVVQGQQYGCARCHKNFSNSAKLKRHIKVHLRWDKSPYKCDRCFKGYCERSILKKHKCTGGSPPSCSPGSGGYNFLLLQYLDLTFHIMTSAESQHGWGFRNNPEYTQTSVFM